MSQENLTSPRAPRLIFFGKGRDAALPAVLSVTIEPLSQSPEPRLFVILWSEPEGSLIVTIALHAGRDAIGRRLSSVVRHDGSSSIQRGTSTFSEANVSRDVDCGAGI
jgi:hypothetical protein